MIIFLSFAVFLLISVLLRRLQPATRQIPEGKDGFGRRLDPSVDYDPVQAAGRADAQP